MPPDPDLPERELLAIIRVEDNRLRAAIARILADLRAANRLDEIAARVAADPSGATVIAGLDRAAGRIADEAVVSFYNAGAASSGTVSALTGAMEIWDRTNYRAVAMAQETSARVVAEVTADQRAVIRSVIVDGTTRGVNPRVMARDLRESIGLTHYQEQIVENYRIDLMTGSRNALRRELRDRRYDRTVARATRARNPVALTQDQIDNLVEIYRTKYRNYRVETIARTEALRSAHLGTDAAWWQSIDAGDVDIDDLVCTWRTYIDGRQRHWHQTMNGQEQPFGVPFVSGRGGLLRYPHDPLAGGIETINCRCARIVRMVKGPRVIKRIFDDEPLPGRIVQLVGCGVCTPAPGRLIRVA